MLIRFIYNDTISHLLYSPCTTWQTALSFHIYRPLPQLKPILAFNDLRAEKTEWSLHLIMR